LVIGGHVASFITQTGALRHGVGVVPATVQCDTFRKTLPLFGETEAKDIKDTKLSKLGGWTGCDHKHCNYSV